MKKLTTILTSVNLLWMMQLDGYMARRQGINSVLGSYLDPLADKVSFTNTNW